MRWTLTAPLTNGARGGRRSRVVLTPRRWRQVSRKHSAKRRWQKSPVTGESAKETVKTIARGMPDVSGVTVVTNARVFYTTREAADAPSVRHSLRPLNGEAGKFTANLGRNAPRDREAMFANTRCLRIDRYHVVPAFAGTTLGDDAQDRWDFACLKTESEKCRDRFSDAARRWVSRALNPSYPPE